MKGFRTLIFLSSLLAFNLHYAQDDAQNNDDLSLDKGSIGSQFEFIIKKSGNYRAQGKKYEVVRSISLDKLKKNVLDSLNAANAKAEALKTTIIKNEATITSLNSKLGKTTDDLSQVTAEKDSMSFLGILVSKPTYNIILWSVITGLLLFLLFFIYRFRNSNILTQEAKTALADVEVEYENHRRRALEREQKISRELQDEINKYRKSK